MCQGCRTAAAGADQRPARCLMSRKMPPSPTASRRRARVQPLIDRSAEVAHPAIEFRSEREKECRYEIPRERAARFDHAHPCEGSKQIRNPQHDQRDHERERHRDPQAGVGLGDERRKRALDEPLVEQFNRVAHHNEAALNAPADPREREEHVVPERVELHLNPAQNVIDNQHCALIWNESRLISRIGVLGGASGGAIPSSQSN